MQREGHHRRGDERRKEAHRQRTDRGRHIGRAAAQLLLRSLAKPETNLCRERAEVEVAKRTKEAHWRESGRAVEKKIVEGSLVVSVTTNDGWGILEFSSRLKKILAITIVCGLRHTSSAAEVPTSPLQLLPGLLVTV